MTENAVPDGAAAAGATMLGGIRVLDLSRVIAGPYCAMLLGDLGADVIKIERPGRGDDLRDWSGARGSPGMSAVFAAVNRSKRGIAVNLHHPEGTRVILELAPALAPSVLRQPASGGRVGARLKQGR